MIYNFTSSQTILAKVMSDLNIKEDGQRVTDMIEWVGESMEKIGAIKQLDYKQSGVDGVPVFKIKDNQITLPDDLQSLIQVAYSKYENGPWLPMRTVTGSFKGAPDKYDPPTTIEPGSASDNLVWPIVGNPAITRNTTNFSSDLQYFLKPGYIMTNMKEGFIKLAYYGTYTDCNGYPLVPENASYQEAIYWYIVMKLSYPEYYAGRLPENRYYDAVNNWNYYRKQAYGEAIMPTQDDMISIKNLWLKLVPEIDSERTFNSTDGGAQKIYNNYYGRIY